MNRFLLTTAAVAMIFAAMPAYAQVMDGPLAQEKPLPNGRVESAVEASQDPASDVTIMADQGAAQGVVVTDRTRPEYQPQGAPVGSFRFLPEISVDELYNDNIYATKNDKVDDFTTIYQPRLALRSDWNRHALNFTAASADGVYSDHASENFNDYLLQADGKIDVTRNTRIGGLFSYSSDHEERGAPNGSAPTGQLSETDPVAFTVRTAQAEFFHQFNRVKADVIYSNQYFNYEHGRTVDTDQYVDNGARNRTDNEVTGRLSFEMTPSYDAYIQGSYNNRDYDNSTATQYYGHQNSDSDGYSVYGGLHADLTGKLFGDIYAGYIAQDYDRIYSNYSGLGYGANGYWNATTLDTFTLNIGHDVEETIIPGAASYVESRARINWDHELMRNIILSGVVGYDHDDYQGINRTDNVLVAGGGVKYLINRHFSLFGNYNYVDRTSNQGYNDYTQNRFLVGIKAAL